MKKLLPLFMLCFLLVSMKAQQASYYESLNLLFEHLDFSEVSTDLLLQRSMPLVRVDSFNGTEMTEFNKMDVDKFGMLYATLYGAALDSAARLPFPDAYMDVWEALQPGDAVPLAIFHYDFHSLRDSALSLNLISLVDSQFYDVPNRPQSPYLLKKLFGVAPLKRYCDSLEMRFSLPTDLLFSNSLSIALFEIDPDDGYGYRSLAFDNELNVLYDEAGEKTLKFRITLSDSTTLVSHARFDVRDGGGVNRVYGSTPDETITIPPATANHAGGSLQFLYDCSQNGGGAGGNGAWKPLLYIEGYEPGIGNSNRDIQDLVSKRRFDQDDPITEVRILDILDEQGYDLIYLDFGFNADHVANNAEVVKEALRLINQRKAELGSNEETIVIGASLGGVVGKYALRQMEIAEEDHDVKLFISLDAEFQGANFPVGIQFMVAHLLAMDFYDGDGEMINLSAFVPAYGEAQEATNAPFLKEMLLYNIFEGSSYTDNFIPNNLSGDDMTSSTFTDFQLEMDNLGELENCEFVAISNGAIDGSGQDDMNFSAGDKILDMDVDPSDILTEFVDYFGDHQGLARFLDFVGQWFFGTSFNVELDVWSLSDHPSNNTKIYEGHTFIVISGEIVNWTDVTRKVRETVPYDNAPGGSLPIDPEKVPSFVNLLQPKICFVPTVSALDITTPENEDLYLNLTDVEDVVNSGLSLSDRYDGSTNDDFGESINQAHGSLNLTNIPFFMSELTSKDNLGEELATNGNGDYILDDRTYNYGDAEGLFDPTITPPQIRHTPHQLNHAMRVEDTGRLWVNRNDLIDFTDNHDNPQNREGNHFDLFINGFKDCEEGGVALYIEDDGEMKIGKSAVGNTADVYVQDGAEVFVGGGGELIMEDGSKYIVESGGETTIEDGGLFQSHGAGKTFIKDGGVFTVKSGGILRMVDESEFLIEPGGQLVLEDGAIVHLWDNTSSPDGLCNIHVQGELVINGTFDFDGHGYFQFDSGNVLTMDSEAEFKLVGKGLGKRFIKLNYDAVLQAGGKKLWLEDGKVQYEPLSSIAVGAGVVAYAKSVEFKQLTTDATSDAIVATDGAERITVSGCFFNKLSYGVNASNLAGTSIGTNSLYLNISDSEFRDCELAVQVASTPSVTLNRTSFVTYESYSLFGLSLDGVNNAYVANCSFAGFDSELGAVYLHDVADYNMVGGTVENNTLGIKAYGISNIDMRSGATVADNETGIKMEGGLDYGVLTMDCANLLNNDIGVTGVDVFLNIDAASELKSNHFSNQDGQLLFRICYDDLAGIVGNQVVAEENLWEGDIDFILYNPSLPGAVSCSFSNMTLDMTPDVDVVDCSSDFPQTPAPAPEEPSTGFTGDDPSCRTNTREILYDRYWSAYEAYLIESNDSLDQRIVSDTLYEGVASIPDTTSIAYSLKCRQLIHIARSRVNAGSNLWLYNGGNNSTANPTNFSGKKLENGDILTIVPNPAYDGFSVNAEPVLYQMEVYNTFGALIESRYYYGKDFVAITNWPAGFYFIKLTNMESSQTYAGKLVVKK